MSEGLITSEVKNSLEKIISQCFYCNRLADRICSVLSVTFVMPIASNLIHHKLAHTYPLLADKISDYMDSRDCTTIYESTPKGDKDYKSVLDCFNEILKAQLELEKAVYESINKAQDVQDYMTKVYLEDFLKDINVITSDVMLLVDKAEMYGDSPIDMMKYDKDIISFKLFEEV